MWKDEYVGSITEIESVKEKHEKMMKKRPKAK